MNGYYYIMLNDGVNGANWRWSKGPVGGNITLHPNKIYKTKVLSIVSGSNLRLIHEASKVDLLIYAKGQLESLEELP